MINMIEYYIISFEILLTQSTISLRRIFYLLLIFSFIVENDYRMVLVSVNLC